MSPPLHRTPELGLRANGSSGRWDVALDESLTSEEWFLELDSPHTYLFFQLQELGVIETALRFLHSAPNSSTEGSDLTLGRFGQAGVSLVWDNEDFPRCFIVVGSQDQSALRLSLYEEDIRMLREALQQIADDLPQVAGEQ